MRKKQAVHIQHDTITTLEPLENVTFFVQPHHDEGNKKIEIDDGEGPFDAEFGQEQGKKDTIRTQRQKNAEHLDEDSCLVYRAKIAAGALA